MRIVTLCMSTGLGGLELYALRSALALSTSSPVIVVSASSGKFRERVITSNLASKILRPVFRAFPLLSAIHLAKILDAHNADILHMHWGKDLPLAALGIKLSRCKPKLVYTRQMQITRRKTDFYHQFLYRELSLMLTITEQLRARSAEMLGDNFKDKVRTLYYGVARPATRLETAQRAQRRVQLGLGVDNFIVGLFGRLEDQKGQHLLLKAIASAKSEGAIITGLIVGHEMEPGYRETLVTLARELDVLDQVVFMDFVDNPQDIMQLCDCVLLATYMETFGLVLPEAMRAGVAVIGSNAGGVPEIIQHETTGLLFEPKNVNDLKQQVLRLYTDTEFRKQLAYQGKERADTLFNDESHFATLREIFSGLAGK